MRARSARAASTGDASCAAKAFDRRAAFHCQSSAMSEMPFEARQRFLDHASLFAEGEAHIGIGSVGPGKEFTQWNQCDACLSNQPFAEGAIFLISKILDAGG